MISSLGYTQTTSKSIECPELTFSTSRPLNSATYIPLPNRGVRPVRFILSCISCTWWPSSPSLFFPTHRDYNWKIRNVGPKTKKKADAQMTEISVSAEGRFWRDENDGDSVPMTESWQACCRDPLNYLLIRQTSRIHY